MRFMRSIALLLVLSVACMVALPAMADDAAGLYKSKCQVCHGPDGKGDTAMGKKLGVRDFHSPSVAKESDTELFKIAKEGKNKMPSYNGKLTDDQIKALVKYIRSLK
jgi:cytochrome c6